MIGHTAVTDVEHVLVGAKLDTIVPRRIEHYG